MDFRCGCRPRPKAPGARWNHTHTHAKSEGCCHGPCQYCFSVCLCLHVSLSVLISVSLHLSPCLTLSPCLSPRLSVSLHVSLSGSMSVSSLPLSPSLCLTLHPSVSSGLSLSPWLSLSFLPPRPGSSRVNESLGRPRVPVTFHVQDRRRHAASTRVTGYRPDLKAARGPGRNDFWQVWAEFPQRGHGRLPLLPLPFFF